MKFLRFNILLLFLLNSPAVLAVADGGAGWKMVAQLTEMLKTMRETLILMNDSVELANDMKRFRVDDTTTWDVFENPLIEKYVGEVGGTEAWAMTTEGLGAAADIDRLVSEIGSEKDKLEGSEETRWRQNRDLLVTYQKMRRLRKATNKNFEKSSKKIKERESNQITANSTTGMFQIMLEDQEQKKIRQVGAVEGEALKNKMRSDVSKSMSKGNYTYGQGNK